MLSISRPQNLTHLVRNLCLLRQNLWSCSIACRSMKEDNRYSRSPRRRWSGSATGDINMAKCVEVTGENVKDFLDSFDTVLLDCDGMHMI